MSTFTFRAFDAEGKRVCGAKSASSEATLREELSRLKYNGELVFASATKFKTGQYKNISSKELAIFCRQMSVLFFSHITLMEGLTLLKEQTGNAQLEITLDEMYKRMDEGLTFGESAAMYPHIFGLYLINMIQIGESSGTLDTVFSNMSEFFEKESKLRKKLRQAVTYPAILAVLMFAIVMLLVLRILPLFDRILQSVGGGQITGLTAAILNFSRFVNSNLIIITGIIAVIVLIFWLIGRTKAGELFIDRVKAGFPFAGYVTKRVITARFARSLASLLKSGVSLTTALEEVKTLVNNKHLEPRFDLAIDKMKNGGKLSDVLKEVNVFPPLFIKMTAIGQGTGHLDEMLDKSASIFDSEVDEAVEKVTAMIEPALIIVLSVIVGIILVSVMLPMIDIMNRIR